MAPRLRTIVRGLLVAALTIAFVGMGIDATSGQQKKKRKSDAKRDAAKAEKLAEAREQAAVRAANAQIAAAKRVLDAAESKEAGAQGRLKSALAGLREATSEFDEAQRDSRRLAKELGEIEQDILSEQEADSPYAKAMAAVTAAWGQLQDIEGKLLAAKENQELLTGLAGAELVEQKEAILTGNREREAVKARLQTAAAAADEVRRSLFRNDDDWQATSTALTKARQEENITQGQTKAGSSNRNEAQDDLQQAKEAAAAARTAIRKAEAVIERAKANDKRKGK